MFLLRNMKLFFRFTLLTKGQETHFHLRSTLSLIADLRVMSLILSRPHTFMEIDHEIISTAILLLPLIQEVVVRIKRKYVHKVLVYDLVKLV